ncbi:hypothetical protein DVH05_010670 [Phytophthora capsici]|nr:hypothetical protein DVH05_010670 [Phytophthora capsici]
MNLLLSVLFVILISSSHGQDLSSTAVDTSSSLQTSSGVGGGAEAQAFRDRFTESPELPGLPSNGTNSTDPDTGSSAGSSSVGFGSSIDNTPGSMSSSDDQVHSVGSDDEDNSVGSDPTTSNGLDSSDSGSVIFSNDDTSASSNLDAASDTSTTPSIAFCLAYSLAMIATTTIFLV